MSEKTEISDPRDALIAWAYRYIAGRDAIDIDGGSIAYGSEALEFFSAARSLVPNVEELSTEVSPHADLAIKGKMQ